MPADHETKLDLLKSAALRALEYLVAPNPYSSPERQRQQVIAHLEDALGVNGLQALVFEVRSDKN